MLCRDDARELRTALGELDKATRHFMAVICAPGPIAREPQQWALDQAALHSAFGRFLESLETYAHQFHNAETAAHLAALQPRKSLNAPFVAMEAVYPKVASQHASDLERMARSAGVYTCTPRA